MAMYARGLKAVVAVKRRSATITEISFVSEEMDYTVVCSFSFGKCNRTKTFGKDLSNYYT